MVGSAKRKYAEKQSNQHTIPTVPRATLEYVPTATTTVGVITSKLLFFLLT